MPVTNYIWDTESDNLLMETDELGSTTAIYTNESDLYGRLISQRRGSTSSYYQFDGLGSTRELTDSAEIVTDTNLYDAWGVNVDSSGTTENPFRFGGWIGYYFGGEVETYYVRERVYQPGIARWMSMDPFSFVDGLDLYLYVKNNPIGSMDPVSASATAIQLNPKGVKRFALQARDPDPHKCEPDEEACISKAKNRARDRIRRNPDCFGRIQCPGGKRASCDPFKLNECIFDAFERLEFRCVDRGVGGCHKGAQNPGHTDSVCGLIKSISSLVCDLPCNIPESFATNCAACPPGYPFVGVTWLCRDQSAGGKKITCNDKELDSLTRLLVHEVSHSCVGGHITTGGKPGPLQGRKPSCDTCGRPDSYNIEAAFVNCK